MSKDSSARYYQKNKWKIQKSFRERYQNLTEEEKTKKREYVRERYKNLSEDEKQRLVGYRKRYHEMWKNNCKVSQ